MKGKEYTKASFAADAGQAQPLADESCLAETWTDKKVKQTYRWNFHISISMVKFFLLDLLSIVIASFASI